MNNRPRRSGLLVKRRVLGHLSERVTGKEGRQVGFCPDRSHSWTSASVGNAEGLVKIQVRNISANVAIAGKAHKSIQVSAIDVDLASGLVNSVGHVLDAVLVHTVCRRVGDHQGGEILPVLGNLGHHVVDVDITVVLAGHDNHLHSRQHGARGVGAVSAGGNQADGAVGIPAGEVVAANCQQSRVLTLAARVGLKRNGVIPGQLGQPRFQMRHHDQISLGVLGRGKGVE